MSVSARTILLMSAGYFTVVLSPVSQAADRMAAGQWEFALTTDAGTHTSKHCVTQDEAGSANGSKSSAREHAAKAAARGHCSLKSFDIQGDTVSYTLTCGDRTIESTATYHGATLEGVLTTAADGKAIKTHVVARRLGVCP